MPRKNNRKKNRSKKQDEQDILVKSGDLFDSDTTPKSHVLIRYPKPTSLDDDAKYFAAVRGFVIPEKYEGFEEAKADYIEEMRIDDESMSASQYKDTRKMITHVTKSETLSLLFPWTTEEITDEQFCKLCFIMDVVTRSLQEPVTSCYRPGATIKDSNYYSILASELIHLPGDIPRNRKGQIQLDLKTKGLDAHIKLFGVYNDTSINRCPCCGCINGVKYKCSRCKAMRYCSKTCQQVHWKVHKRACIHFEDEKMRIIACVLRDEDKWKEEKEEMEKSNE